MLQGQDYCSGRTVDLTSSGTYSSANTAIATVSSVGNVKGVSGGSTNSKALLKYYQQRTPKVTNIFDHVIPKWEARRGPLQLVSWLLHIQLATDLNPQIQGFGGHFAGGDLRDEVGPFSEHELPVKYLLDKIVAQSKGATWIAQVPWGLLHDLALPEDRRIWTILEYEGPGADYASQLRGIAAQPEFDVVDSPRR